MKKILLVLLVSLGLQTQAQTNMSTICDSINISILDQDGPYWVMIGTNLNTTNFPQISYVQDYFWGKNGCLMGTDTSTTINFYTDTTILYSINLVTAYCDSNLCYSCTTSDTLVWDNGSWNWMSMINNTPTSIQEFEVNNFNNNKMYDLRGREVVDIPLGTMYIKNNKKYIRTR
tara:strand:+ start:735 stop:1256 length:522 start_codon:yes stop_codon:yes gene_type:complete